MAQPNAKLRDNELIMKIWSEDGMEDPEKGCGDVAARFAEQTGREVCSFKVKDVVLRSQTLDLPEVSGEPDWLYDKFNEAYRRYQVRKQHKLSPSEPQPEPRKRKEKVLPSPKRMARIISRPTRWDKAYSCAGWNQGNQKYLNGG